jgi:hypothetical protein
VSQVFGIWSDSLDHLVHLLVAFVLALPMGSTERDASGQMGPQSCASRNHQALNSSSIAVEMTIRSILRNGALVRPRSAVPTFRRSFARRSVSVTAATALSRSMVPRFRFGRKVGEPGRCLHTPASTPSPPEMW